MTIIAFAALAAVAFACILAAQRLAARQGRNRLRWMIATATFGPLTLIPLALLRSRDARR
jgi:hypothetical protein